MRCAWTGMRRVKRGYSTRLLANYRKSEDLSEPDGLFAEVEMRLINPTLQASYRRGVR